MARPIPHKEGVPSPYRKDGTPSSRFFQPTVFYPTSPMKRFILISVLLTTFMSTLAAGTLASESESATAQTYHDPYQRYLQMNSADLLKNGWRFLYHTDYPDSAMLCFTIVAERNHERMTPREKKECFEGWCGRWEANNWAYVNYEACLQDYSHITSLQKKWDIRSARPQYYLAMYKISENNIDPNESNIKEAVLAMKSAFNTAVDLKEKEMLLRIFSNLVRTCFFIPDEDISAEWEQTKAIVGSESPTLRIPGLLYSAMQSYHRGDTQLTLAKLNKFLSLYKSETLDSRDARDYVTMLYTKAAILMGQHRDAEAEQTFLDVIDVSYRYRQRELRHITLETLCDLYNETGQRDKLEEMTHHAVMLKDSIWSSRITKGLEQIKFDNLHKEIRRQMIIMEYRQKVLRWVIFATVIVILCFAMFIYSLRNTNRKLREKTNALYDNIRTTSHSPAPLESEPTGDIQEEEESTDETADTNTGPLPAVIPAAERSNQVMTPEASDRLARQIENVMLNTEAPFSGEFSLSRLAQIVGSNTRYVSHVINEVFGSNFQTYVNSVRIREVCRRIDNHRKYSNFTTYAIAESVGFNSRSAFNTAFKKTTGLSAGEYRKISTERHRKGQY